MIDSNRAFLREWLPWVDTTTSVTDSKQFIRECIEQKKTASGHTFTIRMSEEIIGIVSIFAIQQRHRTAEIGYWIAKNRQGNGFMTKAVKSVLKFAFEGLELNRIVIQTASKNIKSASVPKRLMFKKEGVLREVKFLHKQFIDMEIYSILFNEWKASQTNPSK